MTGRRPGSTCARRSAPADRRTPRPTRRALDGFRRLAATRPGSDAVAAAIADIVQLQQPPPLRWPVGEDCVRMLRDRARLTDEDWERLMRGQGWGLAAGDVDDDSEGVRRLRRPSRQA